MSVARGTRSSDGGAEEGRSGRSAVKEGLGGVWSKSTAGDKLGLTGVVDPGTINGSANEGSPMNLKYVRSRYPDGSVENVFLSFFRRSWAPPSSQRCMTVEV